SIALLRPAQQTLTATAVAAKRRHRSFAWTYLGVNTGLGAGGLAAAALITARPSYLNAIILVNALSYALAAAAFAVIRPTARAPASAQRGAARSWRSYRQTLSAPGLKTTLGLHLVWYLGAMSGFTVGVPVYLLAVTTHTALAGLLFGTNTITVILLQVPAASFVEGRQRAAMLQVCFALPAFAWCALGVVGLWPAGWVPTVTLLVAAIVIGTAECLYSPIVEPLIADSVHPEEIGRAYAALTVSRQVGSVLGPILVSGVLAAINNIGWLVLGGGSLVAAAAAHRLRHRLPDAIARTPQTSS
ncbi:MAG TPA: MFS transporter, partial [Mycobacterium sp.]|nr:MFS transporter [Mycobacterium sp.]